MKKFFERLDRQIKMVKLNENVPAEAAYERQEGDKVVGVLPKYLRQFYMVYLDSKAKLDIFGALQYGASVSAIEDGKEVGYARPVKGHKNTWVVYLY